MTLVCRDPCHAASCRETQKLHPTRVLDWAIGMHKILVTNDDGVRSTGIRALADSLRALGDVYVVAPEAEASAIGHALTLRRPLRIEPVGGQMFGVDGTPTDCVNIAVSQILHGVPDLVVSGINKGFNLGDDITYSGTVAGALEGVLLGAPSMAVSQQRVQGDFDFEPAAAAAVQLAKGILDHGLAPRTFLNVNVPTRPTRGLKVTVQARRNHRTSVAEAFDPRHQPYYWIDEAQLEWEADERSDYQSVRAGWISVTPLQPDWTAHDALGSVKSLIAGTKSVPSS